jgi:hypothetical protein
MLDSELIARAATKAPRYDRLMEAVNAIDPAAAEYMDGPARTLPSFSFTDSMYGAFIWRETPQGSSYWADIAVRLAGSGYQSNGDIELARAEAHRAESELSGQDATTPYI